jgi:hypothetical protein
MTNGVSPSSSVKASRSQRLAVSLSASVSSASGLNAQQPYGAIRLLHRERLLSPGPMPARALRDHQPVDFRLAQTCLRQPRESRQRQAISDCHCEVGLRSDHGAKDRLTAEFASDLLDNGDWHIQNPLVCGNLQPIWAAYSRGQDKLGQS